MGNEMSSTMGKIDPYEVLEVARTASEEEITRAFRTKAKYYHPQRPGNTPERLEKYKKVVMAYKIINSDEKKKVYNESVAASHSGMKVGHVCAPASEEETVKFQKAIKSDEAMLPQVGPNDGYGDAYERLTEADVVGGRRKDVCDVPPDLFQGSYDRDLFNKAFEQERVKVHGGLIEKNDSDEIMGFSSTSAGQFAEIAVHNNMVVDAESNDFGRTTQYTDYRTAYGGGSSNPQSIDREALSRQALMCEDATELSESCANDRLRDYNSHTFDLGIDRTQRNTMFKDAEASFMQEKEIAIRMQEERNKRMVEKYGDVQYNKSLPVPSLQ